MTTWEVPPTAPGLEGRNHIIDAPLERVAGRTAPETVIDENIRCNAALFAEIEASARGSRSTAEAMAARTRG